MLEKNEIVYNELPIKNMEQLSYSIFQDEYAIENSRDANKCLKYLNENLQAVYDFIDNIEDIIEEGNLDKELSKIDLYQIGDIINFIETIKIKGIK